MAVFRVALTEDKQRVVKAERGSHPDAHVRRKMLIMWLQHCGLTRQKAAGLAARPSSGTSPPFAPADWTGCGGGASAVRSATWWRTAPASCWRALEMTDGAEFEFEPVLHQTDK